MNHMSIAEVLLGDEKRKVCERFEDYAQKIRTRELRFTHAAESSVARYPDTNEKMSLPTYFGRCMVKYDHQKISASEHQRLLDVLVHDPATQKGPSMEFQARLTLLHQTQELRFLIARNAVGLIDEALTSPEPLIEVGEGYFAKLEKCENERKNLTDERNQLTDELEKLSAEILSLKGQNEECRRQLDECERKRHIHSFKPP